MAGIVTVLLQRWADGDREALDELMPLVYDELHRLAQRFTRGERPDLTLRPTELVSEAYARLAAGDAPRANDRIHFAAVAARVMRRILVDHARRRDAGKRAGAGQKIALDEELPSLERSRELVALDETLLELADFDARKAQIVELHYFGGMTQPEVASLLDLHVNTVARDLRLAQAWLRRRLAEVA